MNIENLIQNGAKIIDVRTPGEFSFGSAPGTINIPLNEVPDRIEEFKEFDQPFVLCCQSGNRSGQATAFLNNHGIECYNGGSWLDVNFLLSKKAS